MNVFEMFGFFMLGSFFNMIILLIFFMVIVGKIRKAVNSNVAVISKSANDLILELHKLVNIFKKGGKDASYSNDQ